MNKTQATTSSTPSTSLSGTSVLSYAGSSAWQMVRSISSWALGSSRQTESKVQPTIGIRGDEDVIAQVANGIITTKLNDQSPTAFSTLSAVQGVQRKSAFVEKNEYAEIYLDGSRVKVLLDFEQVIGEGNVGIVHAVCIKAFNGEAFSLFGKLAISHPSALKTPHPKKTPAEKAKCKKDFDQCLAFHASIRDGATTRHIPGIQKAPYKVIVYSANGQVIKEGLLFERADGDMIDFLNDKYEAYTPKEYLKKTLQIFSQLANGHVHLQSKGYIHYDTKSENDLQKMDSSGNYTGEIADLDLCKKPILGESIKMDDILPSPKYCCPEDFTLLNDLIASYNAMVKHSKLTGKITPQQEELFNKIVAVSYAHIIFSLGSSLYLTLADELPFELVKTYVAGNSSFEWPEVRPLSNKQSEHLLNREVPPQIVAVLARMLQKDYTKRPTIQEFQQIIQENLQVMI